MCARLQVTWPFTAWSIVVISVYVACFIHANLLSDYMVNVGLAYGITSKVPRVQLYMSEAALVPDPAYQATLQQQLLEEIADMEESYMTALYGGTWELHHVTQQADRTHVPLSTQVCV
jgi:hypothetical protein